MEIVKVILKFKWAKQSELRGPNLSFMNQTLTSNRLGTKTLPKRIERNTNHDNWHTYDIKSESQAKRFTGSMSNLFTLCCITQLYNESWSMCRSPNATLSLGTEVKPPSAGCVEALQCLPQHSVRLIRIIPYWSCDQEWSQIQLREQWR